MVAALLLAGGTALALNKVCTTDPCDGTTKADLLIGTSNGEKINGLAGNDLIIGGEGDDTFNDPAVSNAGAGSDTYSFTDGFGLDTLNDTGSASDRDTVDFSKVTKSMQIFAIPEGGQGQNRARDETNHANTVTFGSTTTIEMIVAPAGGGLIFGGKQTNTYVLSAGGGGTVVDFGGQDSDGDGPQPAFPASNDTYTGYKSGKVTIGDHGGSGDVLDLRPRRATDVYFWKREPTGSDPNHLELIFSPGSPETSSDKITIQHYFGESRFRIEKIVFADRTITPIAFQQ